MAGQGQILENTGAAHIRIGSQTLWIYSGSTIVLDSEGCMILPPNKWAPGRPRWPIRYYADGRPSVTYDNMPTSR